MSGGDNPGGGSTTPIVDCEKVNIKTRLSSLNPDVLALVNVADILGIEKKENSIVALHLNEIVGSIASRDVTKIIKCIEDNFEFIAVVNEIDEAKCVVTIKVKDYI